MKNTVPTKWGKWYAAVIMLLLAQFVLYYLFTQYWV